MVVASVHGPLGHFHNRYKHDNASSKTHHIFQSDHLLPVTRRNADIMHGSLTSRLTMLPLLCEGFQSDQRTEEQVPCCRAERA